MELLSVLDAPCEEFVLRDQLKRMTWLTPRSSDGPQLFYSETLGPGATTRSHFHHVDQFQVFVEGRQRLGSATVEPITVHYADAQTPYGPIVGDDTGNHYLTCRMVPDPGARFMPESRSERTRFGGRHATRQVPTEVIRETAGDDESWIDLIPSESDGLGARTVALAPGGSVRGASPVAGAGQVYVVVEGALALADRDHPVLSSIVVRPGCVPPDITAGPDGARIVALSFPRHAGA